MVPSRSELIKLRFDDGMTREDIAEHFDVSIATVRRWIRDLEIPRPSRRRAAKRPSHLTSSGEIVANPLSGETSLERARKILQGRVIERLGYGYYLDGRPATIDEILRAADL